MEYSEFVKRVQDAAQLDSIEAAAAAEVTLGTLGELLSPKKRRDLAAQLRKPMKEHLDRWIERPPRNLTRPHHRFTLEQFYNRVAARSGGRYPAAVKHSQAVMSVLREAVSEGQLADILRELPQEYEELVSGPPKSPVSPSLVE